MATITERFGFTKPSGSDPASVVPLNSNTDLIEQYLGATQDMIAPLYDATAGTYEEGDIVTYESKLYKALGDIDTPEDFDETKWEETTAVSEGGGASNVEANPTGTPTDTLSTIGINGTIYDIEGSGGGGSSYEETSLFSGQTASTGEGVTVNLSGNISDYDAIVIDCGRYGEGAWRHGYIWYLTSDISIGQSFLQIINTNDNATAYWFYDTDTSITWASAYNAYPVTLFSIKGIKFGSGGGGSSVEYSTEEKEVGTWIDGTKIYQKTIHYTHNDTIGDGYTTIASLSNVDYIEFMNCSLYNPTDKSAYALPYAYGSNTTALTYDNGDIKLRVNNDTWNTNWDVVVTVRYTKVVS